MKALFTIALVAVVATAMAQNKTELPRTEFSVSISENTLTLKPGESKQVTLNIIRSKSYAKQKAKLGTMSELPKGVTVSFEPTEGNFETSTAIISAAADANIGSYSLVLSTTLSAKKKGSILKLIVGNEQVAAK